ncbi:hypothetical protein [Cellulomonas pakistanensis]|uniref:TolA protein n=1 Tax=Cellulomonas pakistanensis TaxID=992287 RepID=A0A919PFH4_9CELL|nr:hypothetical protein [Cellulomonas pakistanensis]GIG37597.1 hypothetical protein Cpa01nite_29780 [Cellulomonas pakistanensis]
MADLAEVAAGLYGVRPGDFTAARTAAVRAARQAGDRELATAVGALRKPSSAAAAVNLLVRERPDELGSLLDLGVRLREAQAALAGPDLRALHGEQQRAVGAAADAALGLLGGGGSAAVRGQVEATLRAAMGDPDAAAAVATGLLVRDLFSSGFEPVDVDGAVAVPDAPPLAGAPGRRTPLRAVPAGVADADEAGEGDADEERPHRRRRGRLLTAEEPEQPLRAVPGRRRGRVRVADDDAGAAAGSGAAGAADAAGAAGAAEAPDRAGGAADDAAPAARRRGRVRTNDAGAGRPARAGSARSDGAEARGDPAGAAGRTRAEAERADRAAAARAERERREESARAERERRAEAERAARERRREAAVRSAEQDVALARAEADERTGARDAADERLRAAETRAGELSEVVERAREEIERLRAALASAEQESREVGLEVRHARAARTAAAKQAERAAQRLRAAEAALDAL